MQLDQMIMFWLFRMKKCQVKSDLSGFEKNKGVEKQPEFQNLASNKPKIGNPAALFCPENTVAASVANTVRPQFKGQ